MKRPPLRTLWAVRRLGQLAVLALLLPLQGLAGTVLTREFESKALGRSWSYAIYLPDGYAGAALRYPVLFLLHGNGGNRYSWVNEGRIQGTADALIARGDIPPCLIVMPDAGTTWYVDRTEKMEQAVMQDLLADVERNWKALSTRSGRLIAGLSMGGYGALRFALKYPETFAAAALLSPAIYDPVPPKDSAARRAGVFGAPEFDPAVWKSLNYPSLWPAYLARQQPVPLYINSGDDDEFFIENEAVRLYALLRANRQPAELRIVNGAHVWPVWETTIGEAMRYIFRYAERPAVVDAGRQIRKETGMDTKAFEAKLREDGFDEIFNRQYPAGYQASDHTHPFDVRALVLDGEIRLKVDGVERAYRAGEVFVMAAGCLHAEAVGPQGVQYLVGRRNRKSQA